MSDRRYLTDFSHVLISGATGSGHELGGKSVLANWWHSMAVETGHFDMSLYINPKRHSFVRGREITTIEGLAKSYRAGKRLFDYQWSADPSDPEAQSEAHERLIETVRRLPGDKLVVHDETSGYSDSNMLDWAVSMGGNLDSGSIKSLLIHQRPWGLSEQIRLNCPVKIWVGPWTPEGQSYFQTEKMQEVIDRTDPGKYQWVVTDGGQLREVNQPVPEEFAN